MKIPLAIAAVMVFIVLAVATTVEGAFTILFGWIPFLGRVLPEVKPDGPSVLVGILAVLLFGVGIHWLGRSWRGKPVPPATPWRVRWSVAAVLGVMFLFAAGISMIGISHQVAWLATSDQPVVGVGLKYRPPAERSARMIGMSLTTYHDVYSAFPPGGTFSDTGERRHSWETHLLPFLVYSTNGIDMNSPWDGPENQKYFKCVLPEFINPGFRTPPLDDPNGFGLSHYAANSRVLTANKSTAFSGNTKGTSNTILVGEVNTEFKPWGHPINWRDPAAGLNRGANTFGGPTGTDGVNFVMADGSVRFVGTGVDPAVLRALSDPRTAE